MSADDRDPRAGLEGDVESTAVPAATDSTVEPSPVVDPTPDATTPDATIDGGDGSMADGPADPPAPALSEEELLALAANAPTPSSDEIASLAAAAATALPLSGAHGKAPWETANDPEGTAATAALGTRPSRRIRIKSWVVRLATFGLTVALFAGGVALGGLAFDRSQPPPTAVGDPSTGGVAAPAVVRELTDALATNNSDSLRSAVSGDPYRLLAGEMQSWNMQGVTSVETLGTMQDGPRSVTEIIILGRTAAGDPLVFNLVVHVTDNQIVNFR